MSRNRFTHGIEKELLVRQKLISLGCRAMSSLHRDHARKVDVEVTNINYSRLNWPVDVQLSLKKNDSEKIKDFFNTRTDINYRISMYVRFNDDVEVEDVATIIKKHIINLNSLLSIPEKRLILTIKKDEQSLVPYQKTPLPELSKKVPVNVSLKPNASEVAPDLSPDYLRGRICFMEASGFIIEAKPSGLFFWADYDDLVNEEIRHSLKEAFSTGQHRAPVGLRKVVFRMGRQASSKLRRAIEVTLHQI